MLSGWRRRQQQLPSKRLWLAEERSGPALDGPSKAERIPIGKMVPFWSIERAPNSRAKGNIFSHIDSRFTGPLGRRKDMGNSLPYRASPHISSTFRRRSSHLTAPLIRRALATISKAAAQSLRASRTSARSVCVSVKFSPSPPGLEW